MDYILGIDTSCYTTSLAVVDTDGNLVAEARQVLEVNKGEGGLQQSAALFQHVHNLPILMESLSRQAELNHVSAVAASVRPRPVEGSYMPVFKASEGLGRSLAVTLGARFIPVSHQEGHLQAGLWSAGGPGAHTFLAVHLSGGTSEFLRVTRNPGDLENFFLIELLGGTTDLHAGQFVDRVGVALGLPFPAGPHLEVLARQSQERAVIPSVVRGYEISFSGPETAAHRLLAAGTNPADLALGVEHCIATTLEKSLRRAVEMEQLKDILVVGGVAANGYIRERLRFRLEHPSVGARLFFAEPRYSTDNALGVALLGREYMIRNK